MDECVMTWLVRSGVNDSEEESVVVLLRDVWPCLVIRACYEDDPDTAAPVEITRTICRSAVSNLIRFSRLYQENVPSSQQQLADDVTAHNDAPVLEEWETTFFDTLARADQIRLFNLSNLLDFRRLSVSMAVFFAREINQINPSFESMCEFFQIAATPAENVLTTAEALSLCLGDPMLSDAVEFVLKTETSKETLRARMASAQDEAASV